MSRMGGVWRAALLLAICGCWSGCFPPNESRLDEQRDPNYLTGRSRKMAMDYAGAAEAFEKALEANPRSASAHLELGLIFYENLNDWAAAIYHLERYLKLNPVSNKADSVRQFISVCKQELAKGVPLASLNQQVQKELEKMDKLMRENIELHQQVEQLKLQLAARAALSNSAPNSTQTSPGPKVSAAAPMIAQAASAQALPGVERPGLSPKPDAARSPLVSKTHVVKQGDTPYSIARLYNLPLTSLLSANPGLDARRLQLGQTLAIPTR